jgi:hypothetical protein
MKNKYKIFLLWMSIGVAIGSAIYVNSLSPFFFADEADIISDTIISETIESKISEDIVDIAIKNVIVYPNLFDKRSIYIDIEINNQNGNEFTQITLSNGGKLIASDKIKLRSDKRTYFQSFLVKDNIDFNKAFDIKISSLKLENNISNNRYSVTTSLKTEKLNIALISGTLNYNSKAIISKIDNNFDHFFPELDSYNHNFEEFWLKKYDLVIFDNFPEIPVSDRWFNLFIKKIYSENTSLVMFKGDTQDINSFVKMGPLFGLNFTKESELKNVAKKTFFTKNHFKSVLINDEFFYKQVLSGEDTYFEEAIEWISKKKDLKYSFFLGNKNYHINEPVFIYGFANRVDSDRRDFTAHLYKNGVSIKKEKLYLNPISNYYFNQFEILDSGDYEIKIIDKDNFTIEMINFNILEELTKL